MPSRAAADRRSGRERCNQVLASLCKAEPVPRIFRLIGLLAALYGCSVLIGGLDRLIDEVPDNLVTVGRYADFLSRAREFADHLSPRVRLTGARRALYGKYPALQMPTEAHSGIDRRFAFLPERLTANARACP